MSEVTNDVLVERIEGVTKLINEKFDSITLLTNEKFTKNDETHNALLIQTTKTNGAVASLVRWRLLLTGGAVVIMFLLTAFLIPFSLSYANDKWIQKNNQSVSHDDIKNLIGQIIKDDYIIDIKK